MTQKEGKHFNRNIQSFIHSPSHSFIRWLDGTWTPVLSLGASQQTWGGKAACLVTEEVEGETEIRPWSNENARVFVSARAIGGLCGSDKHVTKCDSVCDVVTATAMSGACQQIDEDSAGAP